MEQNENTKINLEQIIDEYSSDDFLKNDDNKKLLVKLFLNDSFSVNSLEDHKLYLQLLQKFRQVNENNLPLYGTGFKSFITSTTAVGNDGFYSSKLRFLFELIQNVDDCNYPNDAERKLTVTFDSIENPPRIILEYDESGFTPLNVFSVSGIAESLKNNSDKIEIGEKGIGFKSVFGIGKRVHIQSGLFSFYFDNKSTTIPHPEYQNFTPVKGTRLILELDLDTQKDLFDEIYKKYSSVKLLFDENPIVFLNKLKVLELKNTDGRFLRFKINSGVPVLRNGLIVEENVEIALESDKESSVSLSCHRYCLPLTYDLKTCQSRYGLECNTTKRHNIVAIVPLSSLNLLGKTGRLYSFLPTSIKLNVPILLHVPFKLAANREEIDDQGKNEWFCMSRNMLVDFLKRTYADLSHLVKEKIVYYLPYKNLDRKLDGYIFSAENKKISTLRTIELSKDVLNDSAFFYCVDGNPHKLKYVASLSKDYQHNNTIIDPLILYRWIGDDKPFFIPPEPMDLSWYGKTTVHDKIEFPIWVSALTDDLENNDKIVWLKKIGYKFEDHFDELLKKLSTDVSLSEIALKTIASDKSLRSLFYTYFKNRLNDAGRYAHFTDLRVGELPKVESSIIDSISEKINKISSFPRILRNYLDYIAFDMVTINEPSGDFFFISDNCLVLSKNNEYYSFSELTKLLDKNSLFAASLVVEQVTRNLDEIAKIPNDEEYFLKLQELRQTFVDIYTPYSKLVDSLKRLNKSDEQYFSELLQNADDCIFDNPIPYFSITKTEKGFKIVTNEKGFTRHNLKSITGFFDSSKLLQSGDHTGEMGIGFKSVFRVAEKVTIHSGPFDFSLLADRPTVPESENKKHVRGTEMIFELKPDCGFNLKQSLDISKCLCLHNLKKLNLNETTITIEDKWIDDRIGRRIITIDGQSTYHFDVFCHRCNLSESAIASRKDDTSRVKPSADQPKILIYVAKEDIPYKSGLYTTLPLGKEIFLKKGILVDVPFYLTLSREDLVHQNSWNYELVNELYDALKEIICYFSNKGEKLKVLRFVGISADGKWETFRDPFLDMQYWSKYLPSMKIIPIVGRTELLSAKDRCVLVPDIILSIFEKGIPISDCFEYNVIDHRGGLEYWPILKKIGCVLATGAEIGKCILKKCTQLIANDKDFRAKLYQKLVDGFSSNIGFEKIPWDLLQKIPLIPLITANNVLQFVPYKPKLFIGSAFASTEKHPVLNTGIMSIDDYRSIYGSNNTEVYQLNQETLDREKLDEIQAVLQNNSLSAEDKAERILSEYSADKELFRRIGLFLSGLKDNIPLLMIDGHASYTCRFINSSENGFDGSFVKSICIDKRYEQFAKDCLKLTKEVVEICDSDLDSGEFNQLEEKDIEDIHLLRRGFNEIILYLNKRGLIPLELIEKYPELYFLNPSEIEDGTSDDFGLEYEFPSQPLEKQEYETAQTSLKKAFINSPNLFRFIAKVDYEDEFHSVERERKEYLAEYTYEADYDKCFCQLCHKAYPIAYTQCHRLEINPKYAWKEMYVNLCFGCKNRFDAFKRRAGFDKFIQDILNVNDFSEGIIPIDFEDKQMFFTARHLAYIQIILRLEGYPDNPQHIDESILPDKKRYFDLSKYTITKKSTD